MDSSPSARQETGRTILVFDTAEHAFESLQALGLDPRAARDAEPGSLSTPGAGSVVLEELAIAIVDETPQALGPLVQDPRTPVVAAEPEVGVHACLTLDEWVGREPAPVGGIDLEESVLGPVAPLADSAASTWGVRAVRAVPPALREAPWDGTGLKVAVLDTGVDLRHPDLAGRLHATASFVPGESVQDTHGHGTHVAGTIAARTPAGGRRYSTAPGARLLVAKVLNEAGLGTSGGVLAGINWAIGHGAHVIALTLGAPGETSRDAVTYYEAAGRAALERGALVVAAAGNGGEGPVASPASCPSIVSVAAIGPDLRRAPFSCIGGAGGGAVDLAAPGVAVSSAWLVREGSYRSLDGTSMATAHACGVAAVLAQATGLRGRALRSRLLADATRLGEPTRLVGRGIATAPTRVLGMVPCRTRRASDADPSS